MSTYIRLIHAIIPAVCKHIVTQQALAGAAVGVCVEEAADGGVIVAGLQVIEAGFFGRGLSLRVKLCRFFDHRNREKPQFREGKLPSRMMGKLVLHGVNRHSESTQRTAPYCVRSLCFQFQCSLIDNVLIQWESILRSEMIVKQ